MTNKEVLTSILVVLICSRLMGLMDLRWYDGIQILSTNYLMVAVLLYSCVQGHTQAITFAHETLLPLAGVSILDVEKAWEQVMKWKPADVECVHTSLTCSHLTPGSDYGFSLTARSQEMDDTHHTPDIGECARYDLSIKVPTSIVKSEPSGQVLTVYT